MRISAKKLRTRRKLALLSQKDLAILTRAHDPSEKGLHWRAISDIETTKSATNDPRTIKLLCLALGLEPTQLIVLDSRIDRDIQELSRDNK